MDDFLIVVVDDDDDDAAAVGFLATSIFFVDDLKETGKGAEVFGHVQASSQIGQRETSRSKDEEADEGSGLEGTWDLRVGVFLGLFLTGGDGLLGCKTLVLFLLFGIVDGFRLTVIPVGVGAAVVSTKDEKRIKEIRKPIQQTQILRTLN